MPSAGVYKYFAAKCEISRLFSHLGFIVDFMSDEQIKACRELIRVARVAAMTARGLWFIARRDSATEAALREIDLRLDEASEAAHDALNAKPELPAQVH